MSDPTQLIDSIFVAWSECTPEFLESLSHAAKVKLLYDDNSNDLNVTYSRNGQRNKLLLSGPCQPYPRLATLDLLDDLKSTSFVDKCKFTCIY